MKLHVTKTFLRFVILSLTENLFKKNDLLTTGFSVPEKYCPGHSKLRMTGLGS